ncbi:MAG: folate-binding protein YgfZ [Akkermansiaceae bacterium]
MKFVSLAELEELGGVLEFLGPDAVRFLNGQVTQDVRLAVGSDQAIPSCVTDAKGKLQFRIWMAGGDSSESILVFCREDEKEDLELRLTKYLIADDVEVRDLSGKFSLEAFGVSSIEDSERIERGIPKWGAELKAGMLPPEAGLDVTDISYAKGCYIGQEVISRIKSAGKVNRRMAKLAFEEDGTLGEMVNLEGKVRGEVTSVWGRMALGFLKRGTDLDAELFVDEKRVFLREKGE